MLEEWEMDLSVSKASEKHPLIVVLGASAHSQSGKGLDDGYTPPCFNKISSIGFGGGHPASIAQIRILEQWAGLK